MKVTVFSALLFVAYTGAAYAQDEMAPPPPGVEIPPMPIATAPVTITVAPIATTKPKPEPTGLDEIIRAKYPLAVKYKDLGAGWRELTWQGNSYFTKGETQMLDSQEYLIAYVRASRESQKLSREEFMAVSANQQYAVTDDDRFEITLLPAKEVLPYLTRGQVNLRSFDPARHRAIFDAKSGNNAFQENLSVIYLQKIYQAYMAYSFAYLSTTPSMESAFAARQDLAPYADSAVIFNQPGSNQPYKANALLGNKKIAHLRGKGKWVMFYEAQPGQDGMRGVLQFNGNVRRVDAKTWAALSKLSQLDQ